MWTEYQRRQIKILSERIKADDQHLLAIILDSDAILDRLLELARCKEGQLCLNAEWLREVIDNRVERVSSAILEEPSSFRRTA